jgi:hypothetical protein
MGGAGIVNNLQATFLDPPGKKLLQKSIHPTIANFPHGRRIKVRRYSSPDVTRNPPALTVGKVMVKGSSWWPRPGENETARRSA